MSKKKSKKNEKKKTNIKRQIVDEAISFLLIGLSLMLFFSIFTEQMGILGNFFRKLLLGLFGISAYLIPFFIVLHAIWFLINKPEKKEIIQKILINTFMLIFISISFYLFFVNTSLKSVEYLTKFQEQFQNASFMTGGVIGFFLGDILYRVFGFYGSNIIAVLGIVLTVLLSTEISIMQYIKALFLRFFSFFKKDAKEKNKKNEKIKKPVEDKNEIKINDSSEKKEKKKKKSVANKEEIQIFEATVPKSISENENYLSKKLYENSDDDYIFPPFELLTIPKYSQSSESKAEMLAIADKLEETLSSFNVYAKVTQINKGPAVTRYELSPNQGVKVSRIVSLADDIALNLAAQGIRIEAPIPGKSAVGIEVPNQEVQTVMFREVVEIDDFFNFESKLAIGLGKDISGKPIIADIAKMPHLLIAGATGSGKSVCINTIITSILYKSSPKEVKLLMIDPKVVELSIYNGIPHLLIPVVTDPKKASGALNWAVVEMLDRYKKFSKYNVRDISGYNKTKKDDEDEYMCQIVIIIDELSDLMMAAPGEVEDSICRLAQMARAAGIHLIIATQRPSVDVITGIIKANIPSRLAFAVSSGTDSRTILDMTGAEKLLGKGDMLFYPTGMSKPIRVQGAFISDKEVEKIVGYIKKEQEVSYDQSMIEEITSSTIKADVSEDSDEHTIAAIAFCIEKDKASISMIQREFRIGYNRAANIIDELENMGAVGADGGSKGREVLWSKMELDEFLEQKNL